MNDISQSGDENNSGTSSLLKKNAYIDSLWVPLAENKDKLRRRYVELQSWINNLMDNITYKKLGEIAGVNESSIGRFIRNGADLDDTPYKLLVAHLWNNKLWSDTWRQAGPVAQPGMLFYALSEFLDVGEITQERLINETPGTYRSWRPSMHVSGNYVLGMLKVFYDDEKSIINIVEKQSFKGSKFESPQNEQYEGVLVKKSNSYVIIARQSEIHKGPPRVTVVTNFLHQRNGIRTMQGLTIGCYGHSMFAAPAYFERVTEEEAESLEESLDIVPASDVPASVLGKLKFTVVDNIIHF